MQAFHLYIVKHHDIYSSYLCIVLSSFKAINMNVFSRHVSADDALANQQSKYEKGHS